MTRLQIRLYDMNQSVNRVTDMIHLSSYQHSVDHYKDKILSELQHIQLVLEQLDKEEVFKLHSNAKYGISVASFMNLDSTQKEVDDGFVDLYMEELRKNLSEEVEVTLYHDTDMVHHGTDVTLAAPTAMEADLPEWPDRR